MKKHVALIAIVGLLVFGNQAYSAVSNVIGMKVEGVNDISLNGQVIGEIVIINGKSYAPVRDVANAFNADVSFDKEGVKLVADTVAYADEIKLNLGVLKGKKAQLELKISNTIDGIKRHEEKIIPKSIASVNHTTDEKVKEAIEIETERLKAFVVEMKASIPVLEAELAGVTQQIAELEAQQ